jgi:uncharacterized protein YjbJ (UPF0337 family)
MPESGKVDEIKGRLEEAAGALRDDKEQRRKGQADQSSGKLKQANEKLSDAADEFKDAFKETKEAFNKLRGGRAADSRRPAPEAQSEKHRAVERRIGWQAARIQGVMGCRSPVAFSAPSRSTAMKRPCPRGPLLFPRRSTRPMRLGMIERRAGVEAQAGLTGEGEGFRPASDSPATQV